MHVITESALWRKLFSRPAIRPRVGADSKPKRPLTVEHLEGRTLLNHNSWNSFWGGNPVSTGTGFQPAGGYPSDVYRNPYGDYRLPAYHVQNGLYGYGLNLGASYSNGFGNNYSGWSYPNYSGWNYAYPNYSGTYSNYSYAYPNYSGWYW